METLTVKEKEEYKIWNDIVIGDKIYGYIETNEELKFLEGKVVDIKEWAARPYTTPDTIYFDIEIDDTHVYPAFSKCGFYAPDGNYLTSCICEYGMYHLSTSKDFAMSSLRVYINESYQYHKNKIEDDKKDIDYHYKHLEFYNKYVEEYNVELQECFGIKEDTIVM